MKTKKYLDEYEKIVRDFGGREDRIQQAKILSEILEKYFKLDSFKVIETGASQDFEDGCFGLYLAKIVQNEGGFFQTVDIDSLILNRSREIYSRFLPDLEVSYFLSDSVDFLKNLPEAPNFIHLDSWDLDMKNPVPSMLHGWLEFDAIKDKMPSGSICVVDDNFLKGTVVYWNYLDPQGEVLSTEEIHVDYDIVGKGSLIYHWAQKDDSDWDLIGDHYEIGKNVKLILQKR